jgi:hypothetical protein
MVISAELVLTPEKGIIVLVVILDLVVFGATIKKTRTRGIGKATALQARAGC